MIIRNLSFGSEAYRGIVNSMIMKLYPLNYMKKAPTIIDRCFYMALLTALFLLVHRNPDFARIIRALCVC